MRATERLPVRCRTPLAMVVAFIPERVRVFEPVAGAQVIDLPAAVATAPAVAEIRQAVPDAKG